MGMQLRISRIPQLDHLASSIEPHDLRIPVERAEHEGDPTVVTEMRDRFDPASGEIEVGDEIRVQNPKRVVSLRRDIDPPDAGGCCGHEEHMLTRDELLDRIGDVIERLSHGNLSR